MPRVRRGAARRQAKKRIFKAVKGHRGPASKQIRLAKEAAVRANVQARIGRKLKKRDYRGLWIIRLSAACQQRDINYSRFINGLKKARVGMDRKALSQLALEDPAAFQALILRAKAALKT